MKCTIVLLVVLLLMPSAMALSGKINVTNCQIGTFSTCAVTVQVSCNVKVDTGAESVGEIDLTVNGKGYSGSKMSGTNTNGVFGINLVPPAQGTMTLEGVFVTDSIGTVCTMSAGTVDSSTCHMEYGARKSVTTSCTCQWSFVDGPCRVNDTKIVTQVPTPGCNANNKTTVVACQYCVPQWQEVEVASVDVLKYGSQLVCTVTKDLPFVGSRNVVYQEVGTCCVNPLAHPAYCDVPAPATKTCMIDYTTNVGSSAEGGRSLDNVHYIDFASFAQQNVTINATMGRRANGRLYKPLLFPWLVNDAVLGETSGGRVQRRDSILVQRDSPFGFDIYDLNGTRLLAVNITGPVSPVRWLGQAAVTKFGEIGGGVPVWKDTVLVGAERPGLAGVVMGVDGHARFMALDIDDNGVVNSTAYVDVYEIYAGTTYCDYLQGPDSHNGLNWSGPGDCPDTSSILGYQSQTADAANTNCYGSLCYFVTDTNVLVEIDIDTGFIGAVTRGVRRANPFFNYAPKYPAYGSRSQGPYWTYYVDSFCGGPFAMFDEMFRVPGFESRNLAKKADTNVVLLADSLLGAGPQRAVFKVLQPSAVPSSAGAPAIPPDFALEGEIPAIAVCDMKSLELQPQNISSFGTYPTGNTVPVNYLNNLAAIAVANPSISGVLQWFGAALENLASSLIPLGEDVCGAFGGSSVTGRYGRTRNAFSATNCTIYPMNVLASASLSELSDLVGDGQNVYMTSKEGLNLRVWKLMVSDQLLITGGSVIVAQGAAISNPAVMRCNNTLDKGVGIEYMDLGGAVWQECLDSSLNNMGRWQIQNATSTGDLQGVDVNGDGIDEFASVNGIFNMGAKLFDVSNGTTGSSCVNVSINATGVLPVGARYVKVYIAPNASVVPNAGCYRDKCYNRTGSGLAERVYVTDAYDFGGWVQMSDPVGGYLWGFGVMKSGHEFMLKLSNSSSTGNLSVWVTANHGVNWNMLYNGTRSSNIFIPRTPTYTNTFCSNCGSITVTGRGSSGSGGFESGQDNILLFAQVKTVSFTRYIWMFLNETRFFYGEDEPFGWVQYPILSTCMFNVTESERARCDSYGMAGGDLTYLNSTGALYNLYSIIFGCVLRISPSQADGNEFRFACIDLSGTDSPNGNCTNSTIVGRDGLIILNSTNMTWYDNGLGGLNISRTECFGRIKFYNTTGRAVIEEDSIVWNRQNVTNPAAQYLHVWSLVGTVNKAGKQVYDVFFQQVGAGYDGFKNIIFEEGGGIRPRVLYNNASANFVCSNSTYTHVDIYSGGGSPSYPGYPIVCTDVGLITRAVYSFFLNATSSGTYTTCTNVSGTNEIIMINGINDDTVADAMLLTNESIKLLLSTPTISKYGNALAISSVLCGTAPGGKINVYAAGTVAQNPSQVTFTYWLHKATGGNLVAGHVSGIPTVYGVSDRYTFTVNLPGTYNVSVTASDGFSEESVSKKCSVTIGRVECTGLDCGGCIGDDCPCTGPGCRPPNPPPQPTCVNDSQCVPTGGNPNCYSCLVNACYTKTTGLCGIVPNQGCTLYPEGEFNFNTPLTSNKWSVVGAGPDLTGSEIWFRAKTDGTIIHGLNCPDTILLLDWGIVDASSANITLLVGAGGLDIAGVSIKNGRIASLDGGVLGSVAGRHTISLYMDAALKQYFVMLDGATLGTAIPFANRKLGPYSYVKLRSTDCGASTCGALIDFVRMGTLFSPNSTLLVSKNQSVVLGACVAAQGSRAYRAVERYCELVKGTPQIDCIMNDLGTVVKLNGNCFREALNYCVYKMYPDEQGLIATADQPQGTMSGYAVCGAGLAVSVTSKKIIEPMFNTMWVLITHNVVMFMVILVIIVIMIVQQRRR